MFFGQKGLYITRCDIIIPIIDLCCDYALYMTHTPHSIGVFRVSVYLNTRTCFRKCLSSTCHTSRLDSQGLKALLLGSEGCTNTRNVLHTCLSSVYWDFHYCFGLIAVVCLEAVSQSRSRGRIAVVGLQASQQQYACLKASQQQYASRPHSSDPRIFFLQLALRQ